MSKWVSCSSVTTALDALEQDVSPYSNVSLSLCFILTGSTHTQASLLGSALSRGGWEELRGVHVTRGQLCQVSSVLFMWPLNCFDFAGEQPVRPPTPHMQELLPEWTTPPTGCNTAVHQENVFFGREKRKKEKNQ